MNKKTVLAFIKKYPMSILLAIIAINLFSIAGTLKRNGKLDYHKQICVREDAYVHGDYKWTEKEYDAFKRSIARELGIPRNQSDEYCNRITNY